jgi:hypothetical protein
VEATSALLTIFEGCDGAGKTTAAKAYAEATGAKYVHFPALPRVTKGLARMYVEAMLPAVLGYQDVVFDRSWLSETPYGLAFREGQDRLGVASKRMLERLALRCGAVVVWCDPGWEHVRESYVRRKHLEMLADASQLREVYDLYAVEPTDLDEVGFDYTRGPLRLSEGSRSKHPLDLLSAGQWGAPTLIVGESFAERKDQDPFYQWPFASFSNHGCSQWLTNQLESIEHPERELLWVNSDQDLEAVAELCPDFKLIVALGRRAKDKASMIWGQDVIEVPHPQHFKRFKSTARYPLLELLEKV